MFYSLNPRCPFISNKCVFRIFEGKRFIIHVHATCRTGYKYSKLNSLLSYNYQYMYDMCSYYYVLVP